MCTALRILAHGLPVRGGSQVTLLRRSVDSSRAVRSESEGVHHAMDSGLVVARKSDWDPASGGRPRPPTTRAPAPSHRVQIRRIPPARESSILPAVEVIW